MVEEDEEPEVDDELPVYPDEDDDEDDELVLPLYVEPADVVALILLVEAFAFDEHIKRNTKSLTRLTLSVRANDEMLLLFGNEEDTE